MRAIWKYHINTTDTQSIIMPKGAEILCIQMQHDGPCIWTLVETSVEKEHKNFLVCGTGQEVPDDPGKYIGTYQLSAGSLVFHLFEQGN